MFQPWPSLDYSRRSGFSYERWLEDRSHAEIVVKALDRGMIERSDQMGNLLKSIDSISEDQRASFDKISENLVGIDQTLNWGFVELSEGLDRIEQATFAVKNSVENVNKSILNLIDAFNIGIDLVNENLNLANNHLERIEKSVSDVDQAWAVSHYRRAVKAIELGYISDSVEMLEAIVDGSAGRLAYKFDPRFYFLLGACYSGGFKASDDFELDLVKAEFYLSKSVKYVKMEDSFDSEFAVNCLNACAWVNYCIGNVKESETLYAKSLSVVSKFQSEFGLTKSILASGDFDRARCILKYIIVKYREVCLIKMSSDPDFIHFRKNIIDLKAEVLEEIGNFIKSESRFKEFNELFSELQTRIAAFSGVRRKVIFDRISEIAMFMEYAQLSGNVEDFGSVDDLMNIDILRNIVGRTETIRYEVNSEKNSPYIDELYKLNLEGIIDLLDKFRAATSGIISISDTFKPNPQEHKRILSNSLDGYYSQF